MPFHEWQYVFDEETFPLRALETVGLGVSNASGVTTVARLDTANGRHHPERLELGLGGDS